MMPPRNTSLDQLRDHVDGRIAQVGAHVDEVHERISDTNDRIAETNRQLTIVVTKLENIVDFDKRLRGLELAAEIGRVHRAEMDTAVHKFGNDVAGLGTAVAALKTTFDTAENRAAGALWAGKTAFGFGRVVAVCISGGIAAGAAIMKFWGLIFPPPGH
jgi:hypothetical protein